MTEQSIPPDSFLKADDLLEKRKFGEAIEEFRKTIADRPDFMPAYKTLASVLENQKQYDDAIDVYKKWRAADQVIDYASWARIIGKARDPEKELEEFRSIVLSLPELSYGHNVYGIALLELGRTEDAIEEFRKSSEINPNEKWSYNNWGVALQRQNRHEESIEKFQEAIKWDEDFQLAYSNWGTSIVHLTNPEPHLSVYRDAVRKSNSAPLLTELARILGQLKKYDDAVGACRQATAIDPANKDALIQWGELAGKTTNAKAAVEEFIRVSEPLLNDPSILHALGNAYFDLEEYEKALAQYTKAVEIYPIYTSAIFNQGLAFERLKHYDQAASAYLRAIGVEAYERAYSSLSSIIGKLTNPEDTIAEMSETIKSKGDTSMMRVYLGNAYLNLMQYDRAITEFEEAFKKDPKSAMALAYWGIGLEKKRKFQEALTKYKHAVEVNPTYELSYTLWIRLLDKIDYPEKEFEQLQHIIKRQFNNASHWLNEVGLALTSAQLHEKAERAFQLSLKVDPGDANTHYNFGNLLLDQMKYDEAMEQFRIACTKNQDFTYAFHNFAFAIDRLGQYRDAKKHWKIAIENYRRLESTATKNNNSFHFLYCGSIYYNIFRDFDNAEEQFKKGLAINADEPAILSALAQLYFDRKSEEIGIDTESRKRRTRYHVKAMDYFRMCEKVLARRLEHDKDPEDYYILARLYALAADEKKSKEYYQKYLDFKELTPDLAATV